MKFPQHISLSIEHNPHVARYEDVEDFFLSVEHGGGQPIPDSEFATERCRQDIAATGELWEARWYPVTPIGFCVVYAATLDRLLGRLAKEAELEVAGG